MSDFQETNSDIPDQKLLEPALLDLAGDGKEHRTGKAIDQLAEQFRLTREQKERPLSSGKNLVFKDRVYWAKTNLTRKKLLRSTKHGYFQITELGQKALKENLSQKSDFSYLRQVWRDDNVNDKVEAFSTGKQILERKPNVQEAVVAESGDQSADDDAEAPFNAAVEATLDFEPTVFTRTYLKIVSCCRSAIREE
jgi:restriction endonuclease Mrr